MTMIDFEGEVKGPRARQNAEGKNTSPVNSSGIKS